VRSGIETAGLGSGGQAVAVVLPDVELQGAVEAALEKGVPLGVIAEALLLSALQSEA
jgi:hypothetical protein